MLAVAFALWEWASPSLAEAESLQLGWILEIWVRNVVLLTVVAGGLHLFLQRYRVQGDGLRYDARPLTRNKSLFLFNDQVKDNMFLSLVPAIGGGDGMGVARLVGLRQRGRTPLVVRRQPGVVSWCCWAWSPSGRSFTSGRATGCSTGLWCTSTSTPGTTEI